MKQGGLCPVSVHFVLGAPADPSSGAGLAYWARSQDRGLKDARVPSPYSATHRALAADSHPAKAASQDLLPGVQVLGPPIQPIRKDQAGKTLLLGAVVREEAAGWFWVLREWRLSDVLVPANLGQRGWLLHSQELPIGAEERQVLRGHQGATGEI